jgi:molybdenum-dependent DNA-binding transcriptional regulator ModE
MTSFKIQIALEGERIRDRRCGSIREQIKRERYTSKAADMLGTVSVRQKELLVNHLVDTFSGRNWGGAKLAELGECLLKEHNRIDVRTQNPISSESRGGEVCED